jgi:hypothetical protein
MVLVVAGEVSSQPDPNHYFRQQNLFCWHIIQKFSHCTVAAKPGRHDNAKNDRKKMIKQHGKSRGRIEISEEICVALQ